MIKRIKKSFEFQQRGVHGPIPLWGVLCGIFIFYPLVFAIFWAVGLQVLKNRFLYQNLIVIGNVVWILNLFFLLDFKKGILTSFGTYLMYITGIIFSIVGFSGMGKDYNFIGLKISLAFLYMVVVILIQASVVNLDSQEIFTPASINKIYNFVLGPPVILSIVCFFFRNHRI